MKSSDKNKGKKNKGSGEKPIGPRRLVVRKWGNSAGLRIPMSMMYAAKLKVDQEVEARVDGGALIVKPSKGRKQTLDDLISQITPENLHQAVETGKPVGKEVW